MSVFTHPRGEWATGWRKLENYSEAEAAPQARPRHQREGARRRHHAANQLNYQVALVTLYTEWKKPAEAAAYTARLKPVPEAKAPQRPRRSNVRKSGHGTGPVPQRGRPSSQWKEGARHEETLRPGRSAHQPGSRRRRTRKAPPPSSKAVAPAGRPGHAPPARISRSRPSRTTDIGPLYDFKIENVGNLPSKEAGIQFWVTPPCARPAAQANLGPGKLILTGTFKGLVVTTSPQYAFSYSFEMPAFYMGCAIKVIVDPDHHLVEVTRDNNEAIVQTVLPPAPDLVPCVLSWITKNSR